MSSTTTSHVITTFDRSYLFIFVNALCVSSFALCLVPAQKHAFTHVRLIAGGAMHVYLNL